MRKCVRAAVLLAAAASMGVAAPRVALLAESGLPAPARHGLSRLRESLEAKGVTVHDKAAGADFVVLAGVAPGGPAARALKAAGGAMPRGSQALAARRATWQGRPALALCGSDGRGLMYAALEAAGRVASSANAGRPWADIDDAAESPYLAERGVSMYTMQRAWFESRLYDEAHWRRWFDLLARSRINTFTVIFGYENGGFMAPLYPYFFDLPAWPGVRLGGITTARQQRNASAFRAMIRIAHERGVDVIAAVWDHIYRGGVQGGGIPGASDRAGKDAPGLVSGVTAENLAPYTKAALRRFLEVFPEIDGLEFRMHNESGLKRDEMAGFWHEVFGMLAKFKPGMRVTLRAKELPDAIIFDALDQGLKARIETKYWMEQMGMPFHPTHVNRQNQRDRRHGYADLLRYPQRYKVLWRLWSGGTTRLLLWADPAYVRRFAESARLYGGDAIDVNEMLATRMLGEPHDRVPPPILEERHRYYDYEFERYWHYYQVWGRVAYNPATPEGTFRREFARRFGESGVHLMNGLHEASRVLPRIVAAGYRYQLFPTTRGWAEMMRQEDLPKFADLEGTDIEQFLSPRDEARALAAGAETSKRRPEETARWFEAAASAVLRHASLAQLSGAAGKEARSTLTDLRILAALARYYAARLPAAVEYNLYRETRAAAHLDAAIARERAAAAAWEEAVKAAGDVYTEDLAFGVHAVGFPRHWREELGRLRKGLEALEAERGRLAPSAAAAKFRPREADPPPPLVTLDRPATATPGRDLRIAARAAGGAQVKSLRLRYRHLTQFEDYQAAEMTLDPSAGVWSAAIPGAFITPQWDLVYFVEAIGRNGGGRNYPDLEVEAPYVVVPVSR